MTEFLVLPFAPACLPFFGQHTAALISSKPPYFRDFILFSWLGLGIPDEPDEPEVGNNPQLTQACSSVGEHVLLKQSQLQLKSLALRTGPLKLGPSFSMWLHFRIFGKACLDAEHGRKVYLTGLPEKVG
jgi:hypothetical protein